MPEYVRLLPGDPAPYFRQRTPANPDFSFDSIAGRYIVLCFFGTAGSPPAQAALKSVHSRPDLFDDATASFFGVSCDPADEEQGRVGDRYPGYRVYWDFDRSVSRLFGAAAHTAGPDPHRAPYRCLWFLLNPGLRVMHVVPFERNGGDIDKIMTILAELPPPDRYLGFEVKAPVILMPDVFEPALRQRLIDTYEAHGGKESGFMREQDGKTVTVTDYRHKRRTDCEITDPTLRGIIQTRIHRRIVPEIAKVHHFQATRMERYIVGCYAAADGGHFRPHRDNTTKGTAHRRFAVSINLNADYEGGDLSFPEYGPHQFRPPPGGAVVFSCSLLHAVSRVTSGKRYAFLPFLYDDSAAVLREQNNPHLAATVPAYRR